MSVTHYWYRPTELPADLFAAAVADCRVCLAATAIPLGGFEGKGDPVFNDEHIVVNGVAGVDAEPFEIRRIEFDRRGRAEVFSYCKTEGLPYDICVRAALIILKNHLGDLIKVSSDKPDWRDAIALVQQHMRYGATFSLERE